MKQTTKSNSRKSRVPPKAIDLFAGAGGLTEGLSRAGFVSVAANEFDEMAARTFAFNHPAVPLIVRSATAVSASDLLRTAGAKKGEVDLVCGGPPCQGFSLAGQRLSNDPRNELFKEFVRIVRGVEPRCFLFENVAGILSMQNGRVVDAIVREFSSLGYECAFRVLNAADYGVPQARPRFILIGCADGTAPTFPDAIHKPCQRQLINGVSSLQSELFEDSRPLQLTVWDALGDLPLISQGEGSEETFHTPAAQNPYQEARRGRRRPGNLYNHRATKHSAEVTRRYAAIPQGGDNSQVPVHLRTKKINVFKLHQDRVARTVTCNHRTDLLHPIVPRGTTVREAARLQSFDDDYCFFGNLTRKARWVTQDDQVGNAVPPLLAEAIGKHLISQHLV
jgi:DNA (cytosine-5)-methyltransferase 1